MKQIIINIPEVTDIKTAREVIEVLMEPVDQGQAERLADKYGLTIDQGEYGNGITYYPKGSNADDNGLEWYCRERDIDLNDGNLTEGVWISSSDMC